MTPLQLPYPALSDLSYPERDRPRRGAAEAAASARASLQGSVDAICFAGMA